MMGWIAVAVGGALGSLFRYGLSLLANQPGLPLGTWLANVLGSFLSGEKKKESSHQSCIYYLQLA